MKWKTNLALFFVLFLLIILTVNFSLAFSGPPTPAELEKIRADAMAQAEEDKAQAMTEAERQQTAGITQQNAGIASGQNSSALGQINGAASAAAGILAGEQERAAAEATGIEQARQAAASGSGSAPNAADIARYQAEGAKKAAEMQTKGEEQRIAAETEGQRIAQKMETQGKLQEQLGMEIGAAKQKEMEIYAAQKEKEWAELMFQAQSISMQELLAKREGMQDNITIEISSDKFIANKIEMLSKNKQLQLNVEGKQIDITQKEDAIELSDENLKVHAEGLKIQNNKIMLNNIEIKMPKNALKASIGDSIVSDISLKTKNDKPVYVVSQKTDSKLFGFISVKMDETKTIDAVTGDTTETKRPWWSFLASHK